MRFNLIILASSYLSLTSFFKSGGAWLSSVIVVRLTWLIPACLATPIISLNKKSVLSDLKRRDCRKSRQVKISLMDRATLRVWQWTNGQKDPIIQHRFVKHSQLIKPTNFRLFSAMRAYEVEIISNRQSASDVEFIWQALHSLPVRPEMKLEAQWIFKDS